METRSYLFGFASAVLVALTPLAAGAEVVVVASNTPAYAPGAMLTDNADIKLGPKARITVIAGNGKYRVLNGPFSGPHGVTSDQNTSSRALTVLASLVRTTVRDDNSVAAIRNAPGSQRPAFAVDWRRSATHCLVSGTDVQIWRPRKRGETAITIVSPDGARGDISWPTGKQVGSWPVAVKIESGKTYKIGRTGSQFAKEILMRVIPGTATTPVERAIWMAENGCSIQARRYLSGLN